MSRYDYTHYPAPLPMALIAPPKPMSRTPKFEAGDFSKTIGRRLRWLRQIQGLNLEEIERRSKLKGKTVQRYECGGISIPLDAVAVLAAALNVSPSRLCGPLNDFAWLVQEQVAQIEAPNVRCKLNTLPAISTADSIS